MQQPKKPLPVSVFVVPLFLLIAIASIANYSINLAYPNFGWGIFNLIALSCIWRLGIPSVLLLVGTILFVSALVKKSKWSRRVGSAFVIASSVALLLMASNAARSRKQPEIREDDPNKSGEERPHIADHEEEEGTYATDALQSKKDPAAVPGLCEILLDESAMMYLRQDAARALGEIGGEQAWEALEKARASRPPEDLMNAVKHALEDRMGRPKGPRNRRRYKPPTEPMSPDHQSPP